MKKVLLLILTFTFCLNSFTQEGYSVVSVGKAELEKTKLLIESYSLSKSKNDNFKVFVEKLDKNLNFYRRKFKIEKNTNISNKEESVDYTKLEKSGVSFLIRAIENNNQIKMEVYDIKNKNKISEESRSLLQKSLNQDANASADIIYQSITGKKSIFNSKVIFVSDIFTKGKRKIKELFIADFDGENRRQLTFHRGTIISPAISHDGKRVLYSLITQKTLRRNVNLFLLDLEKNKSEIVSSFPGLNTGAVFLNDGANIALTLSHQGNAEIYSMNLKTKKLRRITKNYSPDVDPSVNKKGDLMTFLSGRSGKAMIYTADPRSLEKNVKRISFIGDFNATPRFSPDGTQIAFSSWVDNRFDIYRIDSNGHNLVRLTKNFGSNEDPTYSGDGEFIAFSSQRIISRKKAVQNVYIMDKNGEIISQITKDFGSCTTPRWSN